MIDEVVIHSLERRLAEAIGFADRMAEALEDSNSIKWIIVREYQEWKESR